MGDREKSHRQALEDIAAQAIDEQKVPELAFAAFVFEDRTEFTQTGAGDVRMSTAMDALATHAAAVSEGGGVPLEKVLGAALKMAREKQAAGRGEWEGPTDG